MFHKATAEYLERLGYRTELAHQAEAALASIRQEPQSFDLIVTDLTMPGMSGIEFASALYTFVPSIPVILTTGYDGTKTAESKPPPNVRGFLQKPAAPEALARLAHRLLAPPETPVI